MIRNRGESVELDLAANALLWELQQVVEVTHLFAEQGNEVTKEAVKPLVYHMMKVETNLTADTKRDDAITFLNAHAQLIHDDIRKYHLAVTGEEADY